MTKPVMLIILDGWGYREGGADNATALAKLPNFRAAWEKGPRCLLQASEGFVGLPVGQIGNSEVGHMNLGAGRVVFQDLPLIDRTIEKGALADQAALKDFVAKMKASGGRAHLMGLASPGGVHAHQKHIVALAKILRAEGVPVLVHAFLDGRDVPPESASEQVTALERALGDVKIATLCGRYFAMDRDKRWDRVEKAYELLTCGTGQKAESATKAIKDSYARGISDEFVEPLVLGDYDGMHNGDGVLCANFRTDRVREILSALVDPAFDGFHRHRQIRFAAAAGMVPYADWLNPLMGALFPPKLVENGLGEVISRAGIKQLRIAETEKYAHVTFFFNGGREEPFVGEDRVMVPSPKVATYDLQPEMSAKELADKVVGAIEKQAYGLIILNFANPDMVGHTGSLSAAIAAIEAVDQNLGRIIVALKKVGGAAFVTADHGNCEMMADAETKGPHTAHTLNPVPAFLVNGPADIVGLKDGRLADVAPTLLDLMKIEKPQEMDGVGLSVRT